MPSTGGPAQQAEPVAAKQAAASLAQMLLELLHDVPGLLSDRVHLLALELRRARQSCVQLMVMGFAAAILALTAWAALWALLAVSAAAMGMPWYGVFLLILSCNGVGVWLVLSRARVLVENLALPATLRHFTLAPEALAPAAQAPEDPGPSQ